MHGQYTCGRVSRIRDIAVFRGRLCFMRAHSKFFRVIAPRGRSGGITVCMRIRALSRFFRVIAPRELNEKTYTRLDTYAKARTGWVVAVVNWSLKS
jgi:hypothetical protein